MAHFSRIRTSGLWVLNSVLLPAEVEALDANQSKAVNGDEGGVWAPPSPIEIGGTGGLKITGPFIVTSEAQLQGGATITGGNLSVADDADVQGNATVGGTLAVSGETTISDDLNVAVDLAVQGTATITGEITGNGGATITGGDLNVGDDIVCQGNAEIAGTLDVDGNAAIGGTLGVGSTTVTGTLTATGNTDLGGTLAVAGNATLSGTTIAKGRFRKRIFTVSTDSAQVVNIANYDIVRLPAGVLTIDRVLTVETSGAVAGDVMRVFTEDTVNFLQVQASAVDTPIKRLTGSITWLELIYTGSAWVTSAFGGS